MIVLLKGELARVRVTPAPLPKQKSLFKSSHSSPSPQYGEEQ